MSYGAYAELLSYKDIDLAVDQLLRALLDTKLLELNNQTSDDREYDKKVDALRVQWLIGADSVKDGWGYRYWFDIRARYWKSKEADKELAKVLANPNALALIYQQALVLQQRIDFAASNLSARADLVGARSVSLSSDKVQSARELIVSKILAGASPAGTETAGPNKATKERADDKEKPKS
jgi:hypothetical protein